MKQSPGSLKKKIIGCFGLVSIVLTAGLLICLCGLFLYCKPRYNLAQKFDINFSPHPNSKPIPLSDISKDLIEGVINAQDPMFYYHDGYKFKTHFLNPNGHPSITLQLCGSTKIPDVTFSRKVTKVFLARRIEQEYGKAGILKLYLNRVDFGSGYYGVAKASEGYFGKDAAMLTKTKGKNLAAKISP